MEPRGELQELRFLSGGAELLGAALELQLTALSAIQQDVRIGKCLSFIPREHFFIADVFKVSLEREHRR